jgi:uncharacterized iron-regulated membrane protein
MAEARTRELWIAIHRYTGLAMLVFLALAAVTGCVLCFSKPLDRVLNADLFFRPASAARIDPVAAVRVLEAQRPELRALSFPLAAGPRANVPISVAPRTADRPLGYNEVFLDGGDGHVVGVRQTGPGWDRRHLIEGIFQFHYTLLGGVWGRWLMGIAALAWLISNLVGLYVTFPTRGPFWRNWWKLWTFRLKNPLPRLFLDLHRASGLWLLIGVTVIAFTSVAMNFFDEAFTPMVSAVSPAKPSPFDGPVGPAAPPQRIGFGEALRLGEARAASRGSNWRPAMVSYVPERNLYGVTLTHSGVETYRGLGPISYWFDGAGGRFVYEDNPYEDSGGRKLSRALYPLHSGEVAGWIGVAVVFVLGLATTEMCVTGAYVWWKKRGPRVAMKKAAQARQRSLA